MKHGFMKSEFLLFCQLISKMAFFCASVELHSLFPIKIIFFSETSSRLPNLCYNEKGSCRIRLSVGHQLPKLNRRVRLPYPACRKPRNIQHAWNIPGFLLSRYFYYHIIIYLCCPLMWPVFLISLAISSTPEAYAMHGQYYIFAASLHPHRT